MLITSKIRGPNLAEFVYDNVGHISERTQLHWFLLQVVPNKLAFSCLRLIRLIKRCLFFY